MENKLRKYIWLLLIVAPIILFFYPLFLEAKVPIPADTIVGLYHPFRDQVWKGLEAGVPFKNFLITDAVRQQYPWRKLAYDLIKNGQPPLWNPYTHSGMPLLANIQTAIFYPLNILFFIIPFTQAWTIQVVLQPVLLAVFMFAFLTNMDIRKEAAAIAALALALSGFSVAWLEWNTTLHTLLWLPLALLSVDKIISEGNSNKWQLVLGLSLVSIIFAGFLQTAFYVLLLIGAYGIFRLSQAKVSFTLKKKIISKTTAVLVLVVILTSIQWLPSLRLINRSARAYDQGDVLGRSDWFLPWQNLIQFIAPDFFGNPATLNYWGIFNYMEFVGYIGVLPLIFFAICLLAKERKLKNLRMFFLLAFLSSLIFATPNPLSRLAFRMEIPFLSSSQPSRILVIIVFSLAFLAAAGADSFFTALRAAGSDRQKNIDVLKLGVKSSLALAAIVLGAWVLTFMIPNIWPDITAENISVTRRNLILPSTLVLVSALIFMAAFLMLTKTSKFTKKKQRSKFPNLLFLLFFALSAADLLRFGWKFTPFSDPDFLYPETRTIRFLKSDNSIWRYMTTDRRLMPPNFSIAYEIQTIEGYDPIYLSHYGRLIKTAQKGVPDLEDTAFHRIIRPDNFQSPIYDLLNVKYVLSLRDLEHDKLEKVFQEGETRIYQNHLSFPRAFIIPDYTPHDDEKQALRQALDIRRENIQESVEIIKYQANQIRLLADSKTGGMLVLSDIYYPGWQVYVDGKQQTIKQVFSALRGTMISPGRHEVLFSYTQL